MQQHANTNNAMTNNLPPLAPSLPPYSTGFGLFSLLFDDMQTNMTPAKCTAMDVTSMLLNLGMQQQQ